MRPGFRLNPGQSPPIQTKPKEIHGRILYLNPSSIYLLLYALKIALAYSKLDGFILYICKRCMLCQSHSCSVLQHFIFSIPPLSQVFLNVATSYAFNFVTFLLCTLLMIDEILSGNGLLHSISGNFDQPYCLFGNKASYISIHGAWFCPLDSNL
jgi:hypothetical protein